VCESECVVCVCVCVCVLPYIAVAEDFLGMGECVVCMSVCVSVCVRE